MYLLIKPLVNESTPSKAAINQQSFNTAKMQTAVAGMLAAICIVVDWLVMTAANVWQAVVGAAGVGEGFEGWKGRKREKRKERERGRGRDWFGDGEEGEWGDKTRFVDLSLDEDIEFATMDKDTHLKANKYMFDSMLESSEKIIDWNRSIVAKFVESNVEFESKTRKQPDNSKKPLNIPSTKLPCCKEEIRDKAARDKYSSPFKNRTRTIPFNDICINQFM